MIPSDKRLSIALGSLKKSLCSQMFEGRLGTSGVHSHFFQGRYSYAEDRKQGTKLDWSQPASYEAGLYS